MTDVGLRARPADPASVRRAALEIDSMYEGKDEQTDTYFGVPEGYLKIRESSIDHDRLLFYRRGREDGPQVCEAWTAPVDPVAPLAAVLEAAFGVRARVRKTREIFVRQNLRIQIDRLRGGGTFVVLRWDLGPGDAPREGIEALVAFAERVGLSRESWIRESYCEMQSP